jgi:hypothetical protein
MRCPCGAQVIIFLYLLDEDTSYLILFSSGLGLLIEFWKLTQAMSISVDLSAGYPKLRFDDKSSYTCGAPLHFTSHFSSPSERPHLSGLPSCECSIVHTTFCSIADASASQATHCQHEEKEDEETEPQLSVRCMHACWLHAMPAFPCSVHG